MKTSDITLARLFTGSQESVLRAMSVALPGIVKSYDASSKTATVQPAVKRLVPLDDEEEDDEVETIPAVPGVPVVWPRARGFSLVGSLSAGDSVLLICPDFDISAWQRSGGLSEPDDARLHSWSNAIAIPGLTPDSGSYGAAPSDAAALASVVDKLIGILKGWTIPGTPDGGAALKAAVTTAFPSVPAAAAPTPVAGATSGSAVLKLEE